MVQIYIFIYKYPDWTRKAEKRNFAMSKALSTVSSDDVDDALSSEILVHLTSLRKEDVRDDLQDELTDLKNDSTCRVMLDTLSLCEFWAKMCTCYACC